MSTLEIVLFWVTVFVYVGSFCVHLFSFGGGKDKQTGVAIRMLWAGLAAHTAFALARWVAAGHAPVTNTYELNLTGTWFTMAIFLLFEKLRKADRAIGLVVTPIVFLILGHGFLARTEVLPMTPPYASLWLVVHVIFAWLGFGFYAIATGAAILFVLKTKRPDWKPMAKVPQTKELDMSAYRFTALGFINHAVMIVSGAIWAKKLWGRYWSWDPLETWSLISFLFYAFCLHARTFFGWRDERLAWLIISGMGVLFVSYWGVEWFGPTLHPGP